MSKRLRDRLRNEAGFTLIELLIVIIILGILAGIVVFSVSGLDADSQESACKIDRRTVVTAVEAYKIKNGSAPSSMSDLVPGFLTEASKWHDISGNPIAGEACDTSSS